MKKFSLLLISLLMQVAAINTAYAQSLKEYEYPFDESCGVRSALTYLPDGLTGKGVLVGIIDQGIDFNHINFLDPKTLQTRVKCAWGFVGGKYSEARTPEAIAKLTPNITSALDHGTHVAGVAAGSYAADGWHGIAPEANLLLADQNGQVIQPLEDVFAAADLLDMPLVVNISLEPDIDDGYHPAVLLCEKLTENGTKPGRIIVASSANGGARLSYSEATIGAEGKARFIMETSPAYYDGVDAMNLTFNFKAPKETSLDFRFFFYDTVNKKVVTEGITDLSGAPVDPDTYFKKYLSVNTDNPSPYAYYSIAADYKVNDYMDILPCVEISGAEGTSLRYLRYVWSTDDTGDDYFTPNRKFYGQVNALAMTPAVISVGNLDTHKGEIRKTSSFGYNKFGDKLPDVVAPGSGIISSGKCDYGRKNKENNYVQRDIKMADGNTKTFNWCTMTGTSHSAPLVAGLVALMLQYDKTLTTERVRELLYASNDWTDACDKAPMGPDQAGHGILNTKALFEKLMGETAIKEVSASPADNAIYDLFGRRLSDIPAQGIYIRNGKKVVKK